MHSLYRSSTRGPEDDSVESKHVAPISHYMFNITTVMFHGPSPSFISQTLRDGTPQGQTVLHSLMFLKMGKTVAQTCRANLDLSINR